MINTDGQVGIGFVPNPIAGYKVVVHGRIEAGGFDLSSLIRYKSNVRPLQDALSKVNRLRGVYFDWDDKHGGRHDVGMIAEEVGAVLPEVVRYEENGDKSLPRGRQRLNTRSSEKR